MPLFYFAVAIGPYIRHVARQDTKNQFRECNFISTWRTGTLAVAEIGGFAVLFAGVVKSLLAWAADRTGDLGNPRLRAHPELFQLIEVGAIDPTRRSSFDARHSLATFGCVASPAPPPCASAHGLRRRLDQQHDVRCVGNQ